MPVDGKKKATVSMSKASKEEISISSSEEEEDEGTSEEDDPDYTETNEGSDSEQDVRSDSEENVSEDEDDVKIVKKKESVAASMSKTAAKQVKKEKKPQVRQKRKVDAAAAAPVDVKKRKVAKKVAKDKDEEGKTDKEEKEHPMETGEDASGKDDPQGAKGKGGKKEMPHFSDKNVDYDLFHNSATNVVPRRIKISNNLVITSRMVEQIESKNITNDYPAITFQRKTAGEKMFEFILPLNLVPKIMEAMNLIVKDNGKFFTHSNPQ